MSSRNLLSLLALLLATALPVFADEASLDDGARASASGAAIAALKEAPRAGIENVDGEQLSAAIGHYARARSLLIAAIREFDSGNRVASPDALLDSKEWRLEVVSRAEELERVLDPQPRLSKGGVRYNPDNRLLGEAGK